MNQVSQVIANFGATDQMHHASGVCLIALWVMNLAEAPEYSDLIVKTPTRDGRLIDLGKRGEYRCAHTGFVEGKPMSPIMPIDNEAIYRRTLRLTVLVHEDEGVLMLLTACAPQPDNLATVDHQRTYRFDSPVTTSEQLVAAARRIAAETLSFLQTGTWSDDPALGSGLEVIAVQSEESSRSGVGRRWHEMCRRK